MYIDAVVVEVKKNLFLFRLALAILWLCRKCQIDSEDFISFCGLFRKHELYAVEDWN